MATSRMFLVLLSMALLALTSAQRADEDDENSLQERESLEGGDFHESGIQELKSQFEEQVGQIGKSAKNVLKRGKEKLNKGKGRGGNQGSDGDSLRGQERQGRSQQGRGGQGSRGQKGGKGQNAKGGQKTRSGKGGKRNQKENVEELSEE
ncbi:insulin receptor substrate 4-like isoform X2 [Peromyscus leucopus]|uniref:insulin receptor substrate 4-like isoform X2 n=1 Tax=Peromyscus leucopus TaxID=10041 RepID=UPI0018851D51|nr:insulin receptor substrate 4-like isoform X2 [Peromyscus leucopus]